jgi:hypothetical protein
MALDYIAAYQLLLAENSLPFAVKTQPQRSVLPQSPRRANGATPLSVAAAS